MNTLDVGLVAQNVVRRDGQGRVALELARALVGRGHAVTVYAHRLDDEVARAVRFRRLPRPPGPQALDDLVVLAWATMALRRARHDVACTLGPTARPRCPTVFNLQFSHRGWRRSWGEGDRPGAYHRVHARLAGALEGWCIGRADRVVSSAATLAAEAVPDGVVPVTVVPNGIDAAEFGPFVDGERPAARARLALDEGAFVVGFLGDYHTSRKGLDALLRAMAQGPAGERLVVAARGDDRSLRLRARELGVGDRLVVAGFAPPRDVYAAADVVAVPSLYEPFSLVALEAAACAVPVVVSARAGAAPLLGDGALVVHDPDDAGQLRAALDRVRDDPAGAKARTRAAQRAVAALSWPAVAARAADVVEEVAAATSAGRERHGRR